jgi:hypothetical protein
MSISVFPTPVIPSSPTADTITAATTNTLYEGLKTFAPATYTITCISSTIVNWSFLSGNTIITSGVTTSGTVTVVLGSTADRIRLWINSGTDIPITITKTAGTLGSTTISGTLDEVTTLGSSTYTGTSTSGYGYAILVGGGGAGGSLAANLNTGARGGGSGGVGFKLVELTGSMAVTIGSGGTAVANTTGNPGGQSTFAGMTAGGGGGGGTSTNSGGAGGTVTGADISSSATGTSGVTLNLYPFAKNGTTGGGGNGKSGAAGGGSGIGTGGTGAGGSGNGGNATGYGAGGGGAASQYSPQGPGLGGNGTQGVLYVLRFFI